MTFYGELTPKGRDKVIDREQEPTGPISDEAKQRNAETVALAVERMKAAKLAASMPDFVEIFNQVADMSPEDERFLNDVIRGEEARS